MPVYLVGYAKRMLYSEQPIVLLARRHNAFDQFWKIKFHFQHFPRNTRFLSFDGSTNNLYLFKNHQQTFSWPGERPSSHLKFNKMWFGPNTTYFSEPFFSDFCCREGISYCFYNKQIKTCIVLVMKTENTQRAHFTKQSSRSTSYILQTYIER